jgi:hypothetical protein
MATIADLAKGYIEYIENNVTNKKMAAAEIARRINSLTYSESKKAISKDDKLKIIEEISKRFKEKKTEDGFLIVEASDSSSYIELINAIRNQVNK